MKCELCKQDSADRKLCSVCAEAVRRVVQISTEKKTTQITGEPGKGRGTAASAGS